MRQPVGPLSIVEGRSIVGRRPQGVGWVRAGQREVVVIRVPTAAHHLGHERNVHDGQAEGLDPRQPFLVREGGHLLAKLVEGRVEAEHPTPLTDVGCATLGDGGHAPPRLTARLAARPDGRPARAVALGPRLRAPALVHAHSAGDPASARDGEGSEVAEVRGLVSLVVGGGECRGALRFPGQRRVTLGRGRSSRRRVPEVSEAGARRRVCGRRGVVVVMPEAEPKIVGEVRGHHGCRVGELEECGRGGAALRCAEGGGRRGRGSVKAIDTV